MMMDVLNSQPLSAHVLTIDKVQVIYKVLGLRSNS